MEQQHTRFDRIISQIKNNPIVASVIVLGTIVIALAAFTDAAKNLLGLVTKQRPEEARIELTKMSLQYTPEDFVHSAEKGDVDAIKLFLAAGMDPNATIGSYTQLEGETALMRAAKEGHREVVDILLKAKADVNRERISHCNVDYNDDCTALWNAASRGRGDILRVLLDHGASAEIINGAFVAAAESDDRDILRILLDRGADVKKVGSEALIGAVRGLLKGSDTAKFLLDLGVDANAKREKGPAALHWAASSGNTSLTKVLLDGGADINAKCECPDTNLDGTALLIAAREGHSEVVETLLGRGADVNMRDTGGETALMMAAAAWTEHEDIVRALLDKGADVNVQRIKGYPVNGKGDTALLLAVNYDHEGIVRTLLDKGADVNTNNNNGWTPLLLAAEKGSTGIVEALMDKGAEINVKGIKSRTPLMLAAKNGNTNTVRALLKRGARINEKDVMGKTALKLAQENLEGETRDEMVRLLKGAKAR